MPAFPNLAPTAIMWSLADDDDLPGAGDGTDGPAAPVTPAPEPPGFPHVPELPADPDDEAPSTA